MSRAVIRAFRRKVMTSEMILTVWTVIPGSDSLKISFGSSPIVCKTTAFLPSLVKKTKKSDRQLSNIHHNQHSEQKNGDQGRLIPTVLFHRITYGLLWATEQPTQLKNRSIFTVELMQFSNQGLWVNSKLGFCVVTH